MAGEWQGFEEDRWSQSPSQAGLRRPSDVPGELPCGSAKPKASLTLVLQPAPRPLLLEPRASLALKGSLSPCCCSSLGSALSLCNERTSGAVAGARQGALLATGWEGWVGAQREAQYLHASQKGPGDASPFPSSPGLGGRWGLVICVTPPCPSFVLEQSRGPRFRETYLLIGGVWPGEAKAPRVAVHAGDLAWLHILARAVSAGQVALTAGRMGLRFQGGNWGRLAAWSSLWLDLLPGSRGLGCGRSSCQAPGSGLALHPPKGLQLGGYQLPTGQPPWQRRLGGQHA